MAQLLEGGTLPNGSIIIESGKGAVNIDGSIVRLSEVDLPFRFVVGTDRSAGQVPANTVEVLGSSVVIYRTGTFVTGAVSTTDASVLRNESFTGAAGANVNIASGRGVIRVTDSGTEETFTLELGNVSLPCLLEPSAANATLTVDILGSSYIWSRT